MTRIWLCIFVFISAACTDISSLVSSDLSKCSPDDIKAFFFVAPTDSCRSIPWPPQPPIGFSEITKGYQDFLVDVNPNDEFQLAIVHYVDSVFPSRLELWVVDLCAREKYFLADRIHERIQWSANGWLVFTRSDLQIWKVKANGDSLTQLTFAGNNTYPTWNMPGNKILFQRYLSPGSVFITMDQQGNQLDMSDTVYGFRWPIWSPNESQLLVYKPPYRYYLELNSMDTTRIEVMGNTSTSYDWSADGAYWYWSDRYNMYKTDTSRLVTKTLISHDCENIFYGLLFPHRDSVNAYLVARINNPIGNGELYIDNRIYWMDLSSKKLWQLDLESLWR